MRDKMTWEETIEYIRTKPEFKFLVEKAYFEEDLKLNIERFGKSSEFHETQEILKKYKPNATTILDIGCGNGISAINFALLGYNVSAVEPDPSATIGAGAIKKLKNEYNLNNINVYEAFAEDISFESNNFDVVYVRQAMHHANDLEQFLKESIRVLKPGGVLLTVRDHVVFNEKDKAWFLKNHPLQKFYGGENAYTPKQYTTAIKKGGAIIVEELKFYDSVINYFPSTQKMVVDIKNKNIEKQKKKLFKKLSFIPEYPFLWSVYNFFSGFKPLNEKLVSGRMYSYLAIKK